MKKNKICFIVVYFGKLSSYFNLWLLSASKNKDFQWLIFTNDNTTFPLPNNVSIIEFNEDDFNNLVRYKLNINYQLSHSYKLCDFKPAYGHLFEEYLKEYDYWGYCDLDLIWGDLNMFLREPIEKNIPKILQRGHCSLYKNEKSINLLYQESVLNYPTWKEIFQSMKSYSFDETNGMSKIAEAKNVKEFKDIVFLDISPKKFKMTIVHSKNYNKQWFEWNNGKLFQYYIEGSTTKKKEFAYIHFQKRPMTKLTQDSECFLICPDGFKTITHIQYLNKQEFICLSYINEFKYLYWHFRRFMRKRLNKEKMKYYRIKTKHKNCITY